LENDWSEVLCDEHNSATGVGIRNLHFILRKWNQSSYNYWTFIILNSEYVFLITGPLGEEIRLLTVGYDFVPLEV